MTPLNRDISNVAIVAQGSTLDCVPCSFTWLKQFKNADGVRLSWPYLGSKCKTGAEGIKPSNAMDALKEWGICEWDLFNTPGADLSAIKNREEASYIRDLSPNGLYRALVKAPIAIGISDWNGFANHFLVAYDISEGGQTLKCVDWTSSEVQALVEVPFNIVTTACFLGTMEPNMNSFSSLLGKVTSFLRGKPLLALIGVILGASLLVGGSEAPKEQEYGQSGVALGYTTNVAAPGISSSIRSIPVSSITLYTGETITTSTTIFPAYFVINPNGSTQELVECWGLTTTTTSPTWTDCNRGMSALGGAATSTLSTAKFSHAAGERFTMTNAPPFFNRFLDIYTDQSATGTKRFTADLFTVGSGGNVNGQKYTFHSAQTNDAYIKALSNGASSTFYLSFDGTSEFQLNSSGTVFTAGNGILISGGAISVNASTTAGLAFDSNGKLYVPLSTSGTLSYSPDGSLYAGGAIGTFGDGSDGDVTISASATLTRDMHYNNLTISGASQIATNGYRVFVKGTLTRSAASTAFFRNDGLPGGNGTNGSGSTSGTGGIAGTSTGGTLPVGNSGATGQFGAAAGAAGTGNESATLYGNQGNGSSTISQLIGSTGGRSGVVASPGSPPVCVAPVYGATTTDSGVRPADYGSSFNLFIFSNGTVIPVGSSAGGGSGNGACVAKNAGTVASGGAGAGGGAGGFMHILAHSIVDLGSGVMFRAHGGAGGNAGNSVVSGAGDQAAAGSGGGGGGNGGIIILEYFTLSGGASTSVVGGSGGTGGTKAQNGGGSATNGASGSSGNAGLVFTIN